MIEGNLEDISLPGLLQLLAAESKKSYRLRISKGGQHGSVFVCEGHLLVATFGILEGLDALSEFLNWTDGEFVVEKLPSHFKSTIRSNINLNLSEPGCFADQCAFLQESNVGLNTEIVPSRTFGTAEWQEALHVQPLEKEDYAILGWITDGRTMRQAMREFQFDLKKTIGVLYRLLITRSVEVVRPTAFSEPDEDDELVKLAAQELIRHTESAKKEVTVEFHATDIGGARSRPRSADDTASGLRALPSGADHGKGTASKSPAAENKSAADSKSPGAENAAASKSSGENKSAGESKSPGAENAPSKSSGADNKSATAGTTNGAGNGKNADGKVATESKSESKSDSKPDSESKSKSESKTSSEAKSLAATKSSAEPSSASSSKSDGKPVASQDSKSGHESKNAEPAKSVAAASKEPVKTSKESADSTGAKPADAVSEKGKAERKLIDLLKDPVAEAAEANAKKAAAAKDSNLNDSIANEDSEVNNNFKKQLKKASVPVGATAAKDGGKAPHQTQDLPAQEPASPGTAIAESFEQEMDEKAAATIKQAETPSAETVLNVVAPPEPAPRQFDERRTDPLPLVSIDIERLLASTFQITNIGSLALTNSQLDELLRQVLLDAERGKTLLLVLTDSNRSESAVLASYRYCLDRGYIEHTDPVMSLTVDLLLGRMELEQYLLQRRRITGDQLRDMVAISNRQGISLDKLLVAAGYMLPIDMERVKKEKERFSLR